MYIENSDSMGFSFQLKAGNFLLQKKKLEKYVLALLNSRKQLLNHKLS